ncbi:MAG: DUF1648 domain-containing protein [Candidatus Aenigmatarchaeota archaeon]
MKNSLIASLIIILVSFLTSLYFYPQLPENLASHWNAQGEVDGYMLRFWSLFLMPIISSILLAVLLIVPKIDPLKKNIEKFKNYFNNFIVFILLFLFYIQLLTLFWNKGIRFDMVQLIIPPIGLVFYYAGILAENSKRNWFIGIRTPWTLSDERVWNKVNKRGGKIFKVSGIIAIFSMLVPEYGIFLLIVPVITGSIYLVAYSYFEYMRLNRGNMRRR